jgi:hypothetical protein
MQVAIRDLLIGTVDAPFKAAFPTIPLVTDNAPFDWDNPPPDFVRYEVSFLAGRQLGMAAEPKTRMAGFVYVTAYARAGTGSKKALTSLGWFGDTLKYRVLDAPGVRVQLEADDPTGSSEPRGWYCEHMKFYFHANPA